MRSPFNPTAEDLRLWAYDADSLEPEQDWDLVLSWTPYGDLFLEFASDSKCPKTDYFLALLYLIVGDAVRTKYRTKPKEEVESLLQKAENRFPKHRIYLWVRRSRDLLRIRFVMPIGVPEASHGRKRANPWPVVWRFTRCVGF